MTTPLSYTPLSPPWHDEPTEDSPLSATRFGPMDTGIKTQSNRIDSLCVTVKDFGAKGDGATDDTTALQNALAACPAGGICFVPPGVYRTSAPLVLRPNTTLRGSHNDTLTYTGALANPCAIKPLSGFSGRGIVRFVDKTAGGYSGDSVGHRLEWITLDGSGTSTAGVVGLDIYGFVREVTCDHVTIRNTVSDGFSTSGYGSFTGDARPPQSLRLLHCVADNPGGAGFVLSGVPDTTVLDCNAQGAGYVGFYLAGCPNSMLIGCRAEWAANHGYLITGTGFGTGQGSGGISLVGCLSDRNNFNGVYIDATSSNGQVQLTGCTHRRDGRNGGNGGGGYAAVQANGTTMPVIIDNIAVYPGVNDDGSGTNSPQYGVRASGSTYVAISSGYVHAATTALSNGGTNTTFWRGGALGTATGSTSAPTRTAPAGAGAIP